MQIKIKMDIEIFFSRSTQEHNPSNGGCLSAVRAAMYYLARSHLCYIIWAKSKSHRIRFYEQSCSHLCSTIWAKSKSHQIEILQLFCSYQCSAIWAKSKSTRKFFITIFLIPMLHDGAKWKIEPQVKLYDLSRWVFWSVLVYFGNGKQIWYFACAVCQDAV